MGGEGRGASEVCMDKACLKAGLPDDLDYPGKKLEIVH